MMGWGLYQEVNHILHNSPQPLNISWLQLDRRKKMQSTLLIKRHHRRILNPFAGSLPIRCRKLLIGVDTYNSGTIGNGHSFVSNWAQYSASFRIIALSASVISITKVAAVEQDSASFRIIALSASVISITRWQQWNQPYERMFFVRIMLKILLMLYQDVYLLPCGQHHWNIQFDSNGCTLLRKLCRHLLSVQANRSGFNLFRLFQLYFF
jgi:hypothetical protein